MKERLSLNPIEHSIDTAASDIKLKVKNRIFVPFTRSEIVFATTENGVPVVIKYSRIKEGSKREWLGLNKAYGAGVPVPKPLALAVDRDGTQVLVSEEIAGEPLYKYRQAEIKKQLGAIVRQMHSNVFIDGKEWTESGKADFTYYEKYAFYWLRGSTNGFEKGSKTLALLKKFTDAMRDYCNRTSPVFNHNDIHDGQVFMRENGTLAIIDFENWKEESPLNEMAVYLFHSIRTAVPIQEFKNFIDGYMANGSLTEYEKETFMFYLLFVSARAVSYFQTAGSNYLEKARINHQMVLDFVDREEIWKLI